MPSSRIGLAARNNAIWCDSVCRLHGIPGEFHEDLWLNRNRVPRFYSNMVTLSSGRTAAQLAQIRALGAELTGPWSVKDSFFCLDLAPLGFRPLFEARWLWFKPSRLHRSLRIPGLRWVRVETGTVLVEWEAAWNGDPAQQPSVDQPPIFLPALLADPEIAWIAVYQGRRLVAGAIANRTDEVVGLSNTFVLDGDPAVFWSGFLGMIHDCFPGLPVVGYERGHGLALAEQAGFELLDPLRVWIREA